MIHHLSPLALVATIIQYGTYIKTNLILIVTIH
jgi:hypothetical protein